MEDRATTGMMRLIELCRLDQAGVVTNYVYDRANRMLTRAYPDNLNDTFTYDNASRLTSASSGRYSNSVARAYDAASRLTLETLSVGATAYNLSYGYDADNRQTAVIYPSGDVVDRAFTDRNQLSRVSFNNVAVAVLSYDDGRRLTMKNFGNGAVENRTYRNDNLIASIVTPTVDTFTYTWDSNKRKLTQTESGIPVNNQSYNYDSEDRLTNFNNTNGDTQSWNLSLVGDWNNTIINGTQQNRTHNVVHETTAVDATPLTYDVKGNLTSNSNGQVYAWDVENRLAVATDGFNTLATYNYDALGRRVSKTVGANTTVFVSDGLQEVAEYVNGTLSQSYVYGSYIDEPLVMIKANGTKYYYHTNDLYSVAALTDNNGNIVERYKYDPYGKVTVLAADGITTRTTSIVGNPWTFTGRRLDAETGLMYFRNRTWDVNLGQFVNRDPLGYVDGMSLYRGYFIPRGMDPFGLKDGEVEIVTIDSEDKKPKDAPDKPGFTKWSGPASVTVVVKCAGEGDKWHVVSIESTYKIKEYIMTIEMLQKTVEKKKGVIMEKSVAADVIKDVRAWEDKMAAAAKASWDALWQIEEGFIKEEKPQAKEALKKSIETLVDGWKTSFAKGLHATMKSDREKANLPVPTLAEMIKFVNFELEVKDDGK